MRVRPEEFRGYVVYSKESRPLGVVSLKGEKKAFCNINSVPLRFESLLINIEDRRFHDHPGIDVKGIIRAAYENVKEGRIVQGGSTITQQLARNITQDKRICLSRKLKEIFHAIRLEKIYSKHEILEMYYNEVYWGRNIYGLRAASLEYLSKEPDHLSVSEQLLLLTILRGPNYYLSRNDVLNSRFHALLSILRKRAKISSKKFSKSKRAKVAIGKNRLFTFKNGCITHIARSINCSTYTVYSSLIRECQNAITNYVANSRNPVSVICINKGEIAGVGSTFGTDYPFTFRANVGSTLKPLVYTFLRENDIGGKDLFSTKCDHDLSWEIREFKPFNQDYLSLEEALKNSNNNVFVNASYKIGIEKVQTYLAKTFKHPVEYYPPSCILGATKHGISLYELALVYYEHFIRDNEKVFNNECVQIMATILSERYGKRIQRAFLKTGTTNNDKEQYCMVGFGKLLFGFLRQGTEPDKYSKEGPLLKNVLDFLEKIKNKVYKWL
jgi:membrane peptidoglycan carboxypeptidase